MQDFVDCIGVQNDWRAIAVVKAQLRQNLADALPFLRYALLAALRFDFPYRIRYQEYHTAACLQRGVAAGE